MPKRSATSDSAPNKKAKISPQEMDGKILKVMMMYHMEERFNIKVDDVANELGVHPRTTSFASRWSFLKNKKNLIGPGTNGGLRLTKEGLEEAATPEYKQMMKELSITPKTNKEYHDRIKKYLKEPKSEPMFNLFLKYGSLTKDELSAIIALHTRNHKFFYSFKELKEKGYVETDPNAKKKYRLSDKSFLKGKENRAKDGDIDKKQLAAEIEKGHALMESRKRGVTKSKSARVKKAEAVKEEKGSKGDNDVVDLVRE